MDPLPIWVAVALATVAATYFSLVLGALRSYSLARLEELLEGEQRRLERVRRLLDAEEELWLSCISLRGLAVVVGCLALSAALVAGALREGELPSAWEWATLVAEGLGLGAVLFVGLGDVVPSAFGDRRAEAVLVRLLTIHRGILRLARPWRWLFGGLALIALRVANVQEVEKEEELKDDILSAARAGEIDGVIDEAAADMIENLVEFRELTAEEVMTPRIDIKSVEASDDLATLLEKARQTELSRLPVTEGGLDKIVGVLMVKDLLAAIDQLDLEPPTLFRKPFFVPESKSVPDLLKELRQRKTHMAIVADEYGGTAGLVTIEDLIEELIGDIDDEHDTPDVPVRRVSDSEVDVDAKLHIDDINEEFGTKIPEDEDVETLGGFIALRLGRIPAKGDIVVLNGTSLTVTEADERRAARVTIKLG